MIEFLSGGGSGADTVINVATVEVRFGAVVLIEKLVFNVTDEKIGVKKKRFVELRLKRFVCWRHELNA